LQQIILTETHPNTISRKQFIKVLLTLTLSLLTTRKTNAFYSVEYLFYSIGDSLQLINNAGLNSAFKTRKIQSYGRD
jgi:hypothetical protein